MNKLFKLLFPSTHKEYEERIEDLREDLFALSEENQGLKEIPEVSLADIMRENLALLPHNYTATGITDGNNLNPFEGLSTKELEVRIHELNQVFHNRAFSELLEYLTNKQLHYTMEKAVNDSQIYAGRFNINGLALMKTNVDKYHMLYEESISPPDSYDEHEIINETN